MGRTNIEFARLSRERAIATYGRHFNATELSRAQDQIRREQPHLFDGDADPISSSRQLWSNGVRAGEPRVPIPPIGERDPKRGPEPPDEADGTRPCTNCNTEGFMPDGETCPECDGTGRVSADDYENGEHQKRIKDPPRETRSRATLDVRRASVEQLEAWRRSGRITLDAHARELVARAFAKHAAAKGKRS